MPTSVALACPGFGAGPRGIGTVRGWTVDMAVHLARHVLSGTGHSVLVTVNDWRPACCSGSHGTWNRVSEGIVRKVVKTYRIAYERDASGWWVASVRGVQGCQTQGRTVEETRRRVIEAMGFFVDDAHTTSLVDDVKLPRGAAQAVRAHPSLRKKAEQEDRRAALAARRAVRLLPGGRLKMSARNAARLLELSHQRVRQLTQDQAGR